MQVLRVQSAEGTQRIDISSQDTYRDLYEKVKTREILMRKRNELIIQIANAFSIQSNDFVLYREQNKKSMITRSLAKHNLRFE